MESICKRAFSILSLSLFFTFCMPAQEAKAQYDDTYVSYNDFYQNLAPYGQWIEDPQYGYVWSPNEDGSFRPYYTNGHWAMTDYGNTWVSDYPWGWACFHYGRWTYDNYYGWLWIPGTNWGPAWVSWRYGEGYYGWAPLGPGFEFTSSYGDYSCPNDWWVFIPPQYVYTGNYYHYWYGPRGNTHIIKNTTFMNNTYTNNNITYVSGPRVKQVEDVTHQPVQIFKVSNVTSLNTRVHNNVIKMYRPAQVRTVSATGQRAVPPNVVSAPQPVRTPQPVNTGQGGTPTFRDDKPKTNGHTDQVGTNINETATPAPPKRRDNTNPYEWDVNKPVPQPPRQESAPQPQPQPQPQRPQPARPQPQQPQPQRPQPQGQPQPRPQPAPAPQPARNPAPAPAQREGKR